MTGDNLSAYTVSAQHILGQVIHVVCLRACRLESTPASLFKAVTGQELVVCILLFWPGTALNSEADHILSHPVTSDTNLEPSCAHIVPIGRL